MKTRIFVASALAAAAWLAAAANSRGQCVNGTCFPNAAASAAWMTPVSGTNTCPCGEKCPCAKNCPCGNQPAKVEWKYRSDDASRAYLYVNGRQAGGLDFRTLEFRSFAGGSWGAVEPLDRSRSMLPNESLAKPKSPVIEALGMPREEKLPAGDLSEDECCINYGVDRSKIHKSGTYNYSGMTITKDRALRIIQGDGLEDDSQKLRLTVIGSKEDRQKVLADLNAHPALTRWKDKILLQAYGADDWTVRSGYVTSGTPTIYLQKPDGTVLHRQDDYEGGAEALSGALRKADPDYSPDADPDLRKPQPPNNGGSEVPSSLIGWLLAIVAAAYVWFTNKKDS